VERRRLISSTAGRDSRLRADAGVYPSLTRSRDDRGMARVLALVHAPHPEAWLEAMRCCIVCGCAAALIAAAQFIPF